MSSNDKSKDKSIAQDGYSGGVYSPEGYRPKHVNQGHKSTAGHQPLSDQPPEVISVKAQPRNPPQGR